jgi:aspartate/methionine/tyrosine aminotransferase
LLSFPGESGDFLISFDTPTDSIRLLANKVASLCEYPDLLKHDLVSQIYPKDAIARAEKLLGAIGSIGAYSHSKGVPAIRKNIAAYLESE